MDRKIIIRGACQNNLKNLDFEIPLNSITVVTGLSGSGKSSLAFDTLHAEGQHRYIESFSAYARQFMERMDKPRVNKIEGILPSVAINQRNHVKTSRSTLGTLTEINDYIKQLFYLMATLFCEKCGGAVKNDSPENISAKLLAGYSGQKCVVTFPLNCNPFIGISPDEIEATLRQQGFFRHYKSNNIEEISSSALSDNIYIIADRLLISRDNKNRLNSSIETAMGFGKGLTSIFFPDQRDRQVNFSSHFHCADCDISYTRPNPNMFSFNNPLGACPACNGFGKIIDIDIDSVIPDRGLSLYKDAIKPWSTPSYREAYNEMITFCKKNKISVNIPFKDLPEATQNLIINESSDFYGVRGFFRWLESKTYKMHIRVLLSKYRKYTVCPECLGTHFRKEPLLYRINQKNIADIYSMCIEDTRFFFSELKTDNKNCALLKDEIQSRLEYLIKAGLGYLSLDRQSRTLSGGEIQRASLTTALGSCLVNTLYVLDEPSIGLHARDTGRLMDIIKSLRDTANTIVIVEHDRDIISASDNVIDMGPCSGTDGGNIVFSGSPKQLMECSASITGKYLSGTLNIPAPKSRRKQQSDSFIEVKNASMHNIRNLNLKIPLGMLLCITGVSGSGKSTLLDEIIFRSLSEDTTTGQKCRLIGSHAPDRVVLMDQSPAGKTPRSTPATYIKIFDHIRALFAATETSKNIGFTTASFSFNSGNGRCQHCTGEGFNKIEMQFLADVYVECPYCRGTRFGEDVLSVSYKSRTIFDVLQMTVSEASVFFEDIPKILSPLKILEMVGLDYIRLGQPSTTLSGGEAQRLKIASFIRQGVNGKTLFLFDEPTTGLHFNDIKKLLGTFSFLIDRGHSIIVIEHNMDVIKCSDFIIDLGPEGGEKGGRVVATGTPEEIMKNHRSYTGRFLEKYINQSNAPINSPVTKQQKNRLKNPEKFIEIQGARQHNLRNISVKIPRERFTVITGMSGSGKSTLAFDIIYSESQRRFLETLSPYVRQYINQYKKPEVDIVRGIPPAVAIEQLLSKGGKKSTVATITEVYHYLRLLFAKLAVKHCPSCGRQMASQTDQEIASDIRKKFKNKNIALLSPQIRARKGLHKSVINRAKKAGFQKLRIDGQVINTKDIFAVKRYHEHNIEIITAEIDLKKTGIRSIHKEVKKALHLGSGTIIITCNNAKDTFYSVKSYCPDCSTSLEDADPRLFSFNSPMGECKTCNGKGSITAIIPELVIANPNKSIKEGGLSILENPLLGNKLKKNILSHISKKLGIDTGKPLSKFSTLQQNTLFYGNNQSDGLIKILESPISRDTKTWAKFIDQFRSDVTCYDCKGSRINTSARSFFLNGKNISQVAAMTPDKAIDFLGSLCFSESDKKIAEPVVRELIPRLTFLIKSGLSYLSLDRGADTLSGGESQRIRIAAQAGTNLMGVVYVLDEPTIGLHPHDNRKLLSLLNELKAKGSTVIVVEHDTETINTADFVIDLGPGGGVNGGQVVAAGSPETIRAHPESITGSFLSGRTSGNYASARQLNNCTCIMIKAAGENNLKQISPLFPACRLTVVTGVSGSGKTTLVRDTLYKGLRKKLGLFNGRAGINRGIEGFEHTSRIVEVDQSAIGKTPRSTPATYIGFYGEIRNLFSLTTQARVLGHHPSRFSFNIKGGRCETCSGQGRIKAEMSFLPDMYVECETCLGKRFNEETLKIKYREKNIAEVLAMTVDEAYCFFEDIPLLNKPLKTLQTIGLGYLTLGQPSHTLSGGEAQRIKIASELSNGSSSKTLYILDEPTTGLHIADISNLMEVIHSLVDTGSTVVIIEHNMEVIRQADHIIDLGPGAGEKGGYIVAQGTPEHLISDCQKKSLTARYLKKHMES